jgi:hypothetical protein
MSSMYSHSPAIAMFLDHGADSNTRSEYCSALGLVSAFDHLLVCQLLLGRGADLLVVDAYHQNNA